MNITSVLQERFRPAVTAASGLGISDADALALRECLSMIRSAQNSQFGDYQANMAMSLGKRLSKSPRDVAADITAALAVDDVCETPTVAGPGFINLKLRNAWLISQLELVRHDDRLACTPLPTPLTYVVDFSSPNVAKPLHVGHVRSTFIGDALCRVLRFRGHDVISDNHLGDWGTQFGMIIYGYKHFVDAVHYQRDPVEELGRLYKLVRRFIDYHEAKASLPLRQQNITAQQQEWEQLQKEPPATDPKEEKKRQSKLRKAELGAKESEKALRSLHAMLAATESDETIAPLLGKHTTIAHDVLVETAKLHEGDPLNRSLWNEFLPKCRDSIQSIYTRLNVSFDHELGESFYHDRLANVVQSLQSAGLARESEGAICVFLDAFDSPFLVQKKDGAFLYATTDLATIQYRQETWHPDVILYVVDFRQSEHFDKLIATAAQWGQVSPELRHVKFGTVLGEDGKPYKTRAGDTVGLVGLLDEAETRAYEVVAANDEAKPDGWELDEPTRRHIARVVGIAALKYADLSQNRESDYTFSYDKMLALTGNTATYMQYSYARICGIFAKGNVEPDSIRHSAARFDLNHPAERELALRLLQFEEAVDEVLVDFRPNQLTSYLFELAKSFSSFFEQCPVLKADSDAERESRLLLCDTTARTLRLGLSLLGIDVVTKM